MGIKLHFIEEGVSTQIIWNIFLQEICLSSSIYLLFNHLPVSVWTHGYSSHTVGCNPVLQNLTCCTNCFCFGHGCSSLLLSSLFDTSPLFYFLRHSHLLSDTIRFSRLILYTFCPSPRVRHPSKELVSLTGESY